MTDHIGINKWKGSKGLMSAKEVKDRLAEFDNIDLDDFYTDGKKDWAKVVRLGKEHLAKSVTMEDGRVVNFKVHNDNCGFIYLISSDVGLTKIGYAVDVHKRFNQINTASPVELTLLFYCFVKDAVKLERWLHKMFSEQRIKGEWFNLTVAEIGDIKALVNERKWVKN